MRAVYIIAIAILLTSCGAKKPVLLNQSRTVKDSVVVTRSFEKYLDTVSVLADRSQISLLIDAIKEIPVKVTSDTGRSSVSLQRKGNLITATSDCNAYELEIELLRQVLTIERERFEQLEQTYEVEKKFVPWYWKIGLYGSLGINALLLIAVVFLFVKSKIKTPFT